MHSIYELILRPILKVCALGYLRWAQRSMCASHPDAPYVLLRIAHWEQQ